MKTTPKTDMIHFTVKGQVVIPRWLRKQFDIDASTSGNSDMATKVLDSWALIAFFEDEPAAERVERLLVKAEAGTHNLLLCVVNWGEIYYNTMRTVSQQAAEQKAKEIAGLTIELVGVEANNLELVRQAAIYK